LIFHNWSFTGRSEKVHNYLKERARKEGRKDWKQAHHKSKCGQYNMAEMLLKCPHIMMYTCHTLIAIKPFAKRTKPELFFSCEAMKTNY
jgi:hypothetical protein